MSKKKKALLFILIPPISWMVLVGLYTIYPDVTEFSILSFLLGPLFLLMFAYGVILFLKMAATSPESYNNRETLVREKPSYKTPLVIFSTGISLLVIAFFIIASIRSNQGYSGNPAEITSLPFVFSGIILVISSIVILVIKYLLGKRNSSDKS